MQKLVDIAGAKLSLADSFDEDSGIIFVGQVKCSDRNEFVRLVQEQGSTLASAPFRFLVADGGLALCHSHELGDGTVSFLLLQSVLMAYHSDPQPVVVPSRPVMLGDFVRALMDIWRRNPRAITRSMAGLRGRLRTRPDPSCLDTSLTPRVPTTVRIEPISFSHAEVAALDQWRVKQPSRPTSTMALLWTVAQALESSGYGRSQSWQVLVGLRGTSTRLADCGGNLIGRVLVDPTAYATPGELGRYVRTQIASGEIVLFRLLSMLVEFALGIRSSLSSGQGDRQAPHLGPGCLTALSWSDRGRHVYTNGFMEVVPDAASDGTRVDPDIFTFAVSHPVQRGVSIYVTWLDHRVNIVMCIGALSASDAAAVGRMVERLRVSSLISLI